MFAVSGIIGPNSSCFGIFFHHVIPLFVEALLGFCYYKNALTEIRSRSKAMEKQMETLHSGREKETKSRAGKRHSEGYEVLLA